MASGLQNFLICIEMFVAALCHRSAFSTSEYEDEDFFEDCDDIESSERRSLIRKMVDSIKASGAPSPTPPRTLAARPASPTLLVDLL